MYNRSKSIDARLKPFSTRLKNLLNLFIKKKSELKNIKYYWLRKEIY